MKQSSSIQSYLRKLAAGLCLVAVSKGKAQNIHIERFKNNPIITAGMLPSVQEGDNINGPALINVPNWLPNKLGKYYLYFAHHKGKYIRLAYADKLEGPWKIYQPGTLRIEDCRCNDAPFPATESIRHDGAENEGDQVTHVASPDIYVDNANKKLVLYFHCPLEHQGKKWQYSLAATSGDGIHFKAGDEVLGYPYFRVFKWKDYFYSMARQGQLARSKDGLHNFEQGINPFSTPDSVSRLRHVGVFVRKDTLLVLYSRIGDAPERILYSTIALDNDWRNWKASPPVEVLTAETDWEGGNLPVKPSNSGLYYGKVHELRDPFLYEEKGKYYLLYTAAGENAIAISEIIL